MHSEVVIQQAGCLVAHYGDVCIAVPSGKTDVDAVGHLRSGIHEVARQRPGGIALLFIVPEAASPPTGPVRVAAASMFESVSPKLLCFAAVLEGSGFAVAAKRSVLTWLIGRVLGTTPVKAFAGLVEATDWVASRSKGKQVSCPTAEELRRYILTTLTAAR